MATASSDLNLMCKGSEQYLRICMLISSMSTGVLSFVQSPNDSFVMLIADILVSESVFVASLDSIVLGFLSDN